MAVTEEFRSWATSLSGCDGGDPSADVWICGIEWGYGKDKRDSDEVYLRKLEHYYKNELRDEIAKGEYTASDRTYNFESHNKYPYGRSVSKLYAAIVGREVSDYMKYSKETTGHEIFKMNLYPIAFRNTDSYFWKNYDLDKLTGFEEKYLFRTWCLLHRFPALSKFISEMDKKPKIIIGTGTSYLDDFYLCFAGAGNSMVNDITMDKVNDDSTSNPRFFYWSKIYKQTLLFVVPFFSSQKYGLNSDILLQNMGNQIREISNKQGMSL